MKMPTGAQGKTFCSPITVRFSDIDQAGIVYYPRFFHYFHIVFEEFMAEHVCPLPELLRVRGLGFPAVHAEIDYKIPLLYGDICPVELSLEKLGGASIGWRYLLYKPAESGTDSGKLAARALVVTACMDLSTKSGTLLPSDLRQKLLPFVQIGG